MSRNDPIHIKASRKGTFTKAATAHHMSDTQFESDVLSHPDKFSPAMERKANFARNAKKWHHG